MLLLDDRVTYHPRSKGEPQRAVVIKTLPCIDRDAGQQLYIRTDAGVMVFTSFRMVSGPEPVQRAAVFTALERQCGCDGRSSVCSSGRMVHCVIGAALAKNANGQPD